jgi:hypothetical protein
MDFKKYFLENFHQMKEENSWLTADTRVLGHPVYGLLYFFLETGGMWGRGYQAESPGIGERLEKLSKCWLGVDLFRRPLAFSRWCGVGGNG